MKRRTFIASLTAFVASVPFISMGRSSFQRELDDLCSFIESKRFITLEGDVPFKLFPYQKEILRHIHENQFTVFIKGRQIGMTSLTAAYAAWSQQKKGGSVINFGPNQLLTDDWTSKFFFFGGKPMSGKTPAYFKCLDETNNTARIDYLDYVSDQSSSQYQGKLVIAGTPDHQGNLKSIVNEIKSPAGKLYGRGFKIFHYPVTKCEELWPSERYRYALNNNCRHTELHANFI